MSRRYSVLIVEDHDPLRQILLEFLSDRGFVAHAADAAPLAVDLARRVRPDFGILDMHLPDGSGLDVYRAIGRELGPFPAIMMSGEATSLETHAALDAGVFAFLRKPLSMPVLEQSLGRMILHHFSPGSSPPR